MKLSGVWEIGGWYGLGVSPLLGQDGQISMFSWICLGPVRFEVFTGTMIQRIAQRILRRSPVIVETPKASFRGKIS